MSDTDRLIELLNGLGDVSHSILERVLTENDYYVDSQGEITDRFLQALKDGDGAVAGPQGHSSKRSPQRGRAVAPSSPGKEERFRDALQYVDSESEDEDDEDGRRESNGYMYNEAGPRSPTMRSPPRSYARTANRSRDSLSPARGITSKKQSKSTRRGSVPKRGSGKPAVSAWSSTDHLMHRKSQNLSGETTQYGEDIDTFLDLETKVKSLELRVSGQLKSIRSLETQLADSQGQLTDRDKQLASMTNRQRNLETKEKSLLAQIKELQHAQGPVHRHESRLHSVRTEEALDRYKVRSIS
jgi:uncharacterized coiled-coil protein SlyX